MTTSFRRTIGNCLLLAACLVFSVPAYSQDLPDEIRGYKVHQADVLVTNRDVPAGDEKPDARVRVGDPELTDKSISGITLEVMAEFDSLGHSGTVDFLAFNNFKVNGMAVSIDDYEVSFEFKKNETFLLPKPIKVFVGTLQTLRGALGEIRDSKPTWEVTGTVFVFGKFKKWGMKFKRVVPVEVRLTVKNPVRGSTLLG